jgi:hypothetical protein
LREIRRERCHGSPGGWSEMPGPTLETSYSRDEFEVSGQASCNRVASQHRAEDDA